MEEKITVSDLRSGIMSIVNPRKENEISNMLNENLAQLTLGGDLELDSLDIVELSMLIEAGFKISLSEDIVGRWVKDSFKLTISDVVEDCNKK